jgi:hypothetical protein
VPICEISRDGAGSLARVRAAVADLRRAERFAVVLVGFILIVGLRYAHGLAGVGSAGSAMVVPLANGSNSTAAVTALSVAS